MRNCERPATGDYTRTMYSASEGEEFPEDVRPQPICWVHYVVDRSMEAAIAAFMFGLVVGTVAWWNNADAAVYVYYGLALVAGLVLAWCIRAVRNAVSDRID